VSKPVAETEEGLIVGPDADGQLLVVESGLIVSLGAGEVSSVEGRLLACEGGTIAAGAINAHTHVYSGLAPLGMPPPEPPPENFVQILERVWWGLDRALDPESLRASARYYVAESLLSGTTTLIDHHESPAFIEGSLDVLADACEELGMRAALCYGATERNGGRDEARRGLAECRRFVRANDRRLVTGLVGLHASFTVSDETIREAGELCEELGVPLHVHVAEDGADVADARERGFEGPLERLLELGALPLGSLMAHGVHLTADQVRRAQAEGLWLMQNPRSNRGNGVGYPSALAASHRVALGTDGYPSKLADEVEVLREEAAAHGDDESAVAERERSGWKLAAELFDMDFEPLAVATAGDLVVRDQAAVRHVVVGGRVVVENGALTTANIEEIRDEARTAAPRLWERMASI